MTSKELAALLGVSQSTVSRALNNSDLLSDQTKAYIRQKASEYGFVLNSHAQSLKTNRTGTIGILFPKHFIGMHTNLGLAYLYDLVQKKLRDRGYDVMVVYDAVDDNGISLFERTIKCHKVDGFIILTLGLDKRDQDLIRKYSVPCVYLLNAVKSSAQNCSCTSDSEYGGYLVGMHLGSSADYEPYYIAACETADSRSRLNGYIRGLKEEGRQLPQDHILSCNLSVRSAYDCIMKNKEKFADTRCAVFAYNDTLALGALNAFSVLGMKVPDQIQIAGMDGLPLVAELTPRLTTVELFQDDIAEMGCDMLKKIIDNKDRKVMQMVIKPKLAKGETTL